MSFCIKGNFVRTLPPLDLLYFLFAIGLAAPPAVAGRLRIIGLYVSVVAAVRSVIVAFTQLCRSFAQRLSHCR